MNTIDTKLRTIIAGVVAPEIVIFANQNSPQPAKPYWTLKVQSGVTLGSPEYGAVSNTGTQPVTETKQMTVNLQRFADVRGASFEAMSELRLNLKKPSVQALLRAQKIVIYDFMPVQDVTALLDSSKYEDRASMDIMIGYRGRVTDNVGLIETVDITPGDDSPNSDWSESKITVNL